MIISLTCFYLLNQLYRLLFFLLFPFKTPYIVPCSLTVLNPPPSLPNRNGFTFPAIAQSKNQTHITSGELGLPCSCLLAVACVSCLDHYFSIITHLFSIVHPSCHRLVFDGDISNIRRCSTLGLQPSLHLASFFIFPIRYPHTLPPYVTEMKREEASVL